MNLRAIREYRRALRRFERVINSQLKNCCVGVTLAQCLVLLEIEEYGRLTLGQLASQLRLDNSTLSRTVDGLVGQELLDRLPDDRDRRAVRIQLTKRGQTVCRSIHKENDGHCRQIFQKIPVSKRREVLRSFEILVQAYLDYEDGSEPQARCNSAVSKTRRSASVAGK